MLPFCNDNRNFLKSSNFFFVGPELFAAGEVVDQIPTKEKPEWPDSQSKKQVNSEHIFNTFYIALL